MNTINVPQDGRKRFVIRELFSGLATSLMPGGTVADDEENKNENGYSRASCKKNVPCHPENQANDD